MTIFVKNHVENRKKGSIGEEIATNHLIKRGFTVSKRNYRKPWGELDIIAVKDNTVHFFEVKSITVTSFMLTNSHTPEENVHAFKLKQIRKMVRTYFSENRIHSEVQFQFHVLCVYMNTTRRLARVRWLRNIIL